MPNMPTCSRIPVRRQTRPCTCSVLKPGDTILGMSLAHGGHLTHGASVNICGKLYNAIQYGLNEKEEIDYDQVQKLANEHKPKMIVAGASAYALVIDWKRFRAIADRSAPICSWTWRTTPGWSPRAAIPARSASPTS